LKHKLEAFALDITRSAFHQPMISPAARSLHGSIAAHVFLPDEIRAHTRGRSGRGGKSRSGHPRPAMGCSAAAGLPLGHCQVIGELIDGSDASRQTATRAAGEQTTL